MIPDTEQLETIAQLREGDVAKVPFAVLLHALATDRRSAVLEIERKPMIKRILLDRGVPVDCRSNLLHETLGRFLVARGAITPEQEQTTLKRSVASGKKFGEELIEQGLMTASEIFRALQENLAKKLLDGFTWRSGRFRLDAAMPEIESPLKVKVPQLVITGVAKFSRQEEVDDAIARLVGKRLYLHPQPVHSPQEIRLTPGQRELVQLLRHGKRIDELAAETRVPFADITRLLYGLAILGVVVPENRLPKTRPEPVPAPAAAEPVESAHEPPTRPEPEAVPRRDELMAVYLEYRKQDAFELLGIEESATLLDVENAYLAFSERFAPWRYAGKLQPLTEKAQDLFLAAGRAFGELCDPERRNALIQRRRTLREAPPLQPQTDRFAIRSELLDSEHQFSHGKELMAAGKYREALQQLEFAHDFDPQNVLYRCELAYCRFLDDRRAADQALQELEETVRIDRKCGQAWYYHGLILGELGDVGLAEPSLKRAIKLMAPDRRPIEALKKLAGKAGKKRARR